MMHRQSWNGFIPHLTIDETLGAAIATTVGYLLMDGFYLIRLYRATEIHPFRREMVIPAVAALGLWAAVTFTLKPVVADPIVLLLLEVGVHLVVYPTLIVRSGGVELEDIDIVDTLETRAGIDVKFIRRIARQFAN